MIRRTARRGGQQRAQRTALKFDEVGQLRDQVKRLEEALVDVIAASDAVVRDLARRGGGRSDAAPSAGFAGQWADLDMKAGDAREFFSDVHLDVQARRWLLAPLKRSLLSRVRFGRTQTLRPPLLPRLQPAMAVTR